MIKRTLMAALLLPVAAALMAFFGPAATRVKFESPDWEAAQAKAKAEKKLYFVDFDASYCASCRNMDESTYQDQGLAAYIEKNVVALRLDVQDFDGIMWSQKYEVEALPTMLVFNEDGKLIKKLIGYKSAKDLMAAFQEASGAAPANTTNTSVKSPSSGNAHTSVKPNNLEPIIEDDKPVLKPVTSTRPKTSSGTTPNAHASPLVPANDFVKEKISTGKGLYEFTIRRAQSTGFAIQLGVFSTHEVLMEQAERFAIQFENQKTMVHVDEIAGQQVFKLLVGNFRDKRAANTFRESLRKSGFDGIVKDLTVMK